MLKINGVEVTAPKTYQVDINDIDGDTNRNAVGKLLRDRIAVKRKLEMEWGPLTQDEISTLLSSVQDEFFECEFTDTIEGVATRTMYVGDRTAPAIIQVEDGSILWKGLKMDFIEQ